MLDPAVGIGVAHAIREIETVVMRHVGRVGAVADVPFAGDPGGVSSPA